MTGIQIKALKFPNTLVQDANGTLEWSGTLVLMPNETSREPQLLLQIGEAFNIVIDAYEHPTEVEIEERTISLTQGDKAFVIALSQDIDDEVLVLVEAYLKTACRVSLGRKIAEGLLQGGATAVELISVSGQQSWAA